MGLHGREDEFQRICISIVRTDWSLPCWGILSIEYSSQYPPGDCVDAFCSRGRFNEKAFDKSVNLFRSFESTERGRANISLASSKHKTRTCIAVFIRPDIDVFWASSIQSIPTYVISIKSLLILSSYSHTCRIPHYSVAFPYEIQDSNHIIVVDFIILTISDEVYKSWGLSLTEFCCF
jgi:hypothetical protein